MNSRVSFLFMPLTIFWLILMAGIFLFLLKRKRIELVCGFFSIVWLAMISFYFIPELLVRLLENRFPHYLRFLNLTQKIVLYPDFGIRVYTPENTQMEAFDYINKFGTNNTLILVTDAIHMPRAMP